MIERTCVSAQNCGKQTGLNAVTRNGVDRKGQRSR